MPNGPFRNDTKYIRFMRMSLSGSFKARTEIVMLRLHFLI